MSQNVTISLHTAKAHTHAGINFISSFSCRNEVLSPRKEAKSNSTVPQSTMVRGNLATISSFLEKGQSKIQRI